MRSPRRLEEALPERLALAAVAAVARQHLRVAHDARALASRRSRRVSSSNPSRSPAARRAAARAPSARAARPRRSAPIVGALVERGQDGADRHALLLLERDEPAAGPRTRSGGSSTRRTSGRRAPARCALLGGAVGGFERLGLRGALLERASGSSCSRVLTTMTRRSRLLGDRSPAARRTAAVSAPSADAQRRWRP